MNKQKSLECCPKCGMDVIYVHMKMGYSVDIKTREVFVGYDNRTAVCNDPSCDQLFYYYPRTGRITRRTK